MTDYLNAVIGFIIIYFILFYIYKKLESNESKTANIVLILSSIALIVANAAFTMSLMRYSLIHMITILFWIFVLIASRFIYRYQNNWMNILIKIAIGICLLFSIFILRFANA